ncbi:MAG: transporter [Ramlibacter sp.]|nr:transporter [Ramlibacter sp.]
MSAGISFRQVTKRYGAERSGPLAVAGISFEVPRGTLTTILGPSGCGKTTTLRMIAGLEAPTSGEIFIAGRNVTSLGPADRNVSMMFQSYALFPHMDVLENVSYGLRMSGVPKAAARKRAVEALRNVGLVDFDARLPSELSGGQQQRVALARALVLEPDVLLFDEP